MKNNIILIIKGFIIGLAKIIPGVSGSMLAVSLGLYEKGLDSICNYFKDIKKNTFFLGTIGIGIITAIIFGSKVISYLILNFNLPTMFLFIGLIAGTIPNLIEETGINKKSDWFIVIISFLIIYILSTITESGKFSPDKSLFSYIYILIFGFIDAATMIIPGISGTAIFILIGCYSFILEMFGNLTNFDYILSNFSFIIMFGIGLIIGALIITNLMNYLLKNHKEKTYASIIGFALSSIVILLNNTLGVNFTFIEIIIAIILSMIGYKITKKIG